MEAYGPLLRNAAEGERLEELLFGAAVRPVSREEVEGQGRGRERIEVHRP